MGTTVVFIEHSGGNARRASLETLGAAKSAGQTTVAVICDPDASAVASGLGAFGADKVVHVTGASAYSPDGTAADIASVVQAESAGVCLAAATSAGKDLMPRVAALHDSTPFTDCTGFSMDGDKASAVRPILAGKAFETCESSAPVFCATLRPNAFKTVESDGTAEVVEQAASGDCKVTVVSISAKEVGKLDVKEAPIVVSGGRGMKNGENFKLIFACAKAFGDAAVGASRVAVDEGWVPYAMQVGQTGTKVNPKVYIACGISGSVQHLAGMKTSGLIIAINTDAKAAILAHCDYFVIGDLFDILPALAQELEKDKGTD